MLVVLRVSWLGSGHPWPDRYRQVMRGEERLVLISVCDFWHSQPMIWHDLSAKSQVNYVPGDAGWSQMEDFHWLQTCFISLHWGFQPESMGSSVKVILFLHFPQIKLTSVPVLWCQDSILFFTSTYSKQASTFTLLLNQLKDYSGTVQLHRLSLVLFT